ncbi:DUF5309 family protein [Actinomycetaceae bacterium MB13-C1-2]|nr:DUF5309 family protein [Actinomycetaceae bacterium MB13-C1-2]
MPASITGMGTTYNLPNYVGELFCATPADTPFLSAIGGLTGGREANATFFEWQGYTLREGADDRQRLEGAAAPDAEARVRYTERNVVEIHQEKVEISYTKLGATGQRATDGEPQVTIGGISIPVSELKFQIDAALKSKALDIDKSFIAGTFQSPDDNTAPRKTRGLLQATTTNVVTAAKDDLDEEAILDLFQKVWDKGGIAYDETRTVMVNSTLKRLLTKIFIKDKGYQEESRTVGGVSLQTFETDFGRANLMLERHMPVNQISVVSLDECAPRFLPIPGKGHFFVEPLAKTGASEAVQLYGEIGLEYGDEKKHGKLIVTGM